MNYVVVEWIQKAEGDHVSAIRELRARKNPNFDAACFHSQQCVEKYLKGLLQSWQVPFAKTHDLAILLDACTVRHPEWEAFRDDCKLLTQYAVVFRYPGESATKEEAKQAVWVATAIRKILRPLFLTTTDPL
jgi:HEPN domain-containing protein